MPAHQHLRHCSSAASALAYLGHGLLDSGANLVEHAHELRADELHDPYDALLAHDGHMTTVLKNHFRDDVTLHTIHHAHDDNDVYSRAIVLRLRAHDQVIEFGLVRVDLTMTAPAVRDEILARRIPLGDVLINHDVLRRIEPKWYLRFDAGSPVLAHFESPKLRCAFGRIGVIHCDHVPAIELLEVVSAGPNRAMPRDASTGH